MKGDVRAKEAEAVIADIGARRFGIVTTTLAHEAGVSREALRHHVADGRLVRVGRGVYRLRDHPWNWHSQLRAGLDLAGPDAVVALRSAARLHGFWAFRSSDAVEIWVPRPTDSRC